MNKIISETFSGNVERIDRCSNDYFQKLNEEYEFNIIGINITSLNDYLVKSYTIQITKSKNLKG